MSKDGAFDCEEDRQEVIDKIEDELYGVPEEWNLKNQQIARKLKWNCHDSDYSKIECGKFYLCWDKYSDHNNPYYISNGYKLQNKPLCVDRFVSLEDLVKLIEE